MEEVTNKPVLGNPDAPEENSITLTELFRVMRVKWLWFVVSIVIALCLGGLYLMRATPMYTRSVDVLLKDDSSQSVVGDLSMLGVNPVPSETLNEMFIMSSPEIMERVVVQLGLNEVYSYPKLLRKAQYYKNEPLVVAAVDSLTDRTRSYSFKMTVKPDSTGVELSDFKIKGKKVDGSADAKFGEPVETPAGVFVIGTTKFMAEPAEEIGPRNEIYYSFTTVKSCAESYCKRLQTSYDEERGNVVTLAISCPSPKQAEDVLRTVVEAYKQRWVTDKNNIAVVTSQFIDERLAAIEQELGDVESNITSYKSSHRLMDAETMASIYLTQSTENKRALEQLAQDISIGRYIKNELASNDITRMLPATADIAGTNILQMITAYNIMVGERNAKLQSLPEESPIIKQKTEAIQNSRAAILASVDAALEALNKRYDAIAHSDRQTQEQLANAPGQAKYLMNEERKQKVMEELYVFLLQRREENELSQAFTVYNTRMVTEPYGPKAPSSPNTKMVLLLAVIIGFIIPTLIIYIKEVTNTKVRSRKDIEDLPIPFLGEVPLTESRTRIRLPFMSKGNADAPTTTRHIFVAPHTGDVANEAFRMIRTNIDFMGAMDHRNNSDHGKTIMVVSLNAGSGKTFVSLNTAAIFALKGKRTCLVDMDLRKGTVSLNAGNPSHGLTDYLVGKNKNLDDLIVRNINGIEGFDILPEGVKPPNPTELLYSPNLEQLIEELRERYDYVIFDCPPVEIVADARLLNPFIDMTIFVMRSGLFEKSDINVLRGLYESRRYNNLAVVLNATDSVHGVYGSYGYGYNYSNRKRRRK